MDGYLLAPGSPAVSSYSIKIVILYFIMFRMIKSRRLRWVGHVARIEEGRSAFKILTGKPTGKRPLGRPRRRWTGNIRMDLK